MNERIKAILEGKGLLLFCLFSTACLPIVLYSSSGYGDSYISYWAANSLSEFGEFLNYSGERAETGSSMLYILLLAFAHKLTFLSFSLVGGILGIVFGLMTVLQVHRLGNCISPAVGGVAALLTALNPVFLYWVASGTESTLMSWLLVSSVLVLVRLIQSDFSGKLMCWTALLLSSIQLLRPEGSLLIIAALIFCWIFAWYRYYAYKPEEGALLRRSIALLFVLSILVMGLIVGWRIIYFGEWYPLPVAARVSGLSASMGNVLRGYSSFLNALMFQSSYALSMLLFACVTFWALLQMVRFPAQQSPVLWVTSIFSGTYLGFILLSGGDWVLGAYGEWITSAKYFSQIAPLMALMLAIGICSIKVRWLQYFCGGVIGVSLVFSVFKLLSVESTGVPVHIGVQYANQMLRHSQTKGLSWFDATNRILARDVTLIANLNETIAKLQPALDRPVRLMGRQTGMVMHHVAQTNYGNVTFNDLRGLSDTALLDCEPSKHLKRHTIGLDLHYSYLFENWDAYSDCVERPDIIFDILIDPSEMQALEDGGYSIIYEQNGFKGNGKNRLTQHAFFAARNELVSVLEPKKVYLNEEYWHEEDARLFDAEKNTRFVVIGHGRGLLEGHTDVLEEIADLINLQKPHYVFVLGDFVRQSVDEEWDQLEKHMFDRLDAPVIFVPGNHETRSNAVGDDSVYRRRMPPFPDVITTNHVNFLQLNSSLRLPEITQYLTNAFTKIDEGKPTILLTHHRVWNAGIPTSRHVTTFSSQQFLPLIDGRVDAIIAGDGAGNFIAESSPIGVPAYMSGIGMKGRYKPLFFSIGDIGPDGELDFRPFEVALNPYHPWYTTLEPLPTLPFLLKNAPPIGVD